MVRATVVDSAPVWFRAKFRVPAIETLSLAGACNISRITILPRALEPGFRKHTEFADKSTGRHDAAML